MDETFEFDHKGKSFLISIEVAGGWKLCTGKLVRWDTLFLIMNTKSCIISNNNQTGRSKIHRANAQMIELEWDKFAL